MNFSSNLFLISVCVLTIGCSTQKRPPTIPLFNDAVGPVSNTAKSNDAPKLSNGSELPSDSANQHEWSTVGDGKFVRKSGNGPRTAATQGLKEPIDFAFRDANISYVVDFVLGELLDADYVVPPQAQGKITLRADNLTRIDQVLLVLNSAFEPHGWVLAQQESLFVLIRSGDKTHAASVPELVDSSTQSVPLSGSIVFAPCCAAASQLADLVRPFIAQGVVITANNERGLIFVNGDPGLARAAVETLKMFDVDWFDAGAISLIALENVSPETLVRELKPILSKSAPDVEVEALPRLDAVVLLSPRKRGLATALEWVKRLDKAVTTGTKDMLIYQALNRSAEELSNAVSAMAFGDLQPQNGARNNNQRNRPQQNQNNRINANGVGREGFGQSLSITLDEAQDIIVAQGAPAELQKLHDLLKLLDKPRAQVLIEAVILEVSVSQNDSLGIQWQGLEGNVDLLFSNSANGSIAPRSPGVSATYFNQDISVIIDALASKNDIEIISSPRLITLSNETASLQIGDQVPVITQSAVNVATTNATLVNTVNSRDTGVQLSVTPRVRAGGVVEILVSQEVSDVIPTTSSGIDSPTIRRRSFESTLVIPDRQSVALGGLMSSTVSINNSGVPLLKDIPGIGALFRNQSTSRSRTELIVLLRPTILPNPQDAVSQTQRLKSALQRLSDRFGTGNEVN